MYVKTGGIQEVCHFRKHDSYDQLPTSGEAHIYDILVNIWDAFDTTHYRNF